MEVALGVKAAQTCPPEFNSLETTGWRERTPSHKYVHCDLYPSSKINKCKINFEKSSKDDKLRGRSVVAFLPHTRTSIKPVFKKSRKA